MSHLQLRTNERDSGMACSDCNLLDIVFQSKIRELEDRLREEAHQRKLVQDKTAEVVRKRPFA